MEFSPFKKAGIVPAETAPKKLPKEIRESKDIQAEFLTKGVFFDVYDLKNPERKEGEKPYVLKDFRSGDTLKTPAEQVAMFQHQYYEWNLLRKEMGEAFFPESYWVRNEAFSDDEAHGFFAKPGETANTYTEVIKTQLDRQLADRYSTDDKKKGAFKRLMSAAGKTFSKTHEEKPFIGAVMQERINGIPFSEVLKRIDKKDPNYPLLRKNVQELITGLQRFHGDNDAAAFTWHGLESDNVVAEVDTKGKLTGRVSILDGNFTERPGAAYRSSVLKKLHQNVFAKIEKAFEL